MAVPDDDRIIGVQEAAEILDTSDQMVRKLARKGRIPAYRLPGGRVYKFFREELLEHKRKNTTPTEGEGDAVIDSRGVAELLGMDVQLVRKYARERRIPAYRHTGRRGYEFSRNEVLAHIRNSRLEADGVEDGEAEAGGGVSQEHERVGDTGGEAEAGGMSSLVMEPHGLGLSQEHERVGDTGIGRGRPAERQTT